MTEQLGQYTLLETLGDSVLSTVYKARHAVTGSVVALKALRLDVLDDVGSREMDFRLREGFDALAPLVYPGIGRVLEMRREDRFALIVRELIDGPPITTFLGAQGAPDVRNAITAAVQMLEALDFAHSRSVVHRNLKPSNVLVSQGARIKIVDFGMLELAARNRTDTGLLVGKMDYMAPEQFLGSSIDHRCDIHAAGVILYELLTGISPFADASGFAMPKVLELVPTAPSRVNPAVSLAFDAVLARALAKAPGDRFATAGRFREELCAAYLSVVGREPPQFLSVPQGASGAPEEQVTQQLASTAAVKTTVILRRPTTWSVVPPPEVPVAPVVPAARAGNSSAVAPPELLEEAAAPRVQTGRLSPGLMEEPNAPRVKAGSSLPGVEESRASHVQVAPASLGLVEESISPRAQAGSSLPGVDEPRVPHVQGAPSSLAHAHDGSARRIGSAPTVEEPTAAGGLPMQSGGADAIEPPPRPVSKRVVPVTDASIALGGRVLARFVGPIAIVLSRRAAKDSQDEGAYFEALAAHLADPKERSQFLREVGRRV